LGAKKSKKKKKEPGKKKRKPRNETNKKNIYSFAKRRGRSQKALDSVERKRK